MVKRGNRDPRRILLFDTQPVWLHALEQILGDARFETASAQTEEQALAMLRDERVAVMMVGIDGIPDWEKLLERVRGDARSAKVIVVATDAELQKVERVLALGADAFVTKRASPEDIPFAVRQVLSPEVYEAWPVAAPAKPQHVGRRRRGASGLTSRERQILALLATGQSNAEIARELAISEPTVKGHLWRLYKKLGVTNRTAAAHASRSRFFADD